MQSCDALIVGAGPAGSSCARTLARAGLDVLVLDRARFPRDKVCAGWITPPVLTALDIAPSDYAATGRVLQEIRGFRTGLIGGSTIPTIYGRIVSYGIRRCEFDQFLLERSGARVRQGTPVVSLRRTNGGWTIDDEFRAPVIVGAGGHFCPVAKWLGRDARAASLVVAKEAEFRLKRPDRCTVAGDVPELLFCPDLEGYGWFFRKGDYLNVGIGRRRTHRFAEAARAFEAFVRRAGEQGGETTGAWRGHAYVLAGGATRPPVDDGVLLAGDAAGLAYAESGEGIRTAVESGIAAAEVILAAGGRYDRETLAPYVDRVGAAAARRSGSRLLAALPAAWMQAAARRLLRSPSFTRLVVLDRWFLRTSTWRPGTVPGVRIRTPGTVP
jgi:geranylgeranyl reductase family protein